MWWEPLPGAWTLRRQPDVYHEWAFGPASLTWLTIERPETVEGMVEMLERGHRLLLQDLDGLSGDEDLELPVKTNWGETWPAWRIFWTMIHHDAHHGAEIGCLRDLYFHTRRLAAT
jgi:hypothetical protein